MHQVVEPPHGLDLLRAADDNTTVELARFRVCPQNQALRASDMAIDASQNNNEAGEGGLPSKERIDVASGSVPSSR